MASSRAGLSRRHFIATGLLASAGCPALAQDYPGKPVRIVHAYPGGPLDAVVRGMADRLSTLWGQPVVIDAKPGANEIIAANTVAKAAPDGLTLFVGTESTFTNNPYLFSTLPYDPQKDLVPVSHLFDLHFGLIVRGDLPAQTVPEFIALMKKAGPRHSYASFGVGNTLHVGMESFLQAAGIQMMHVPYKSAGQLMQDLLGGTVDAVMSSSVVATQFGAGGRLRMLAINGSKRQKVLPAIPTFMEVGFPQLDIRTFVGVAVPAGTPDAIQRKLQADAVAVITQAEFQEKVIEPNGYDVIGSSSAQFQEFIARKRPEMRQRIQALGIKLD